MDWCWNFLVENWRGWLLDVVKQAAGVIAGLVGSWFLLFRAKWRDLERLKRGESDDFIFQMHRLYPVEGATDQCVLLFRNVAPKTTLNDLYDNPQARSLVKDLGDQTSLTDPILKTEGRIGFEVLNDALSHIAGLLATTPFPREPWLFAMTCEDRKVVRKRCIRCFLVRPDDLARFADWRWCRSAVRVERPWHWFRVVALHCIAKTWQEEQAWTAEREKSSDVSRDMPLVDEQQRHNRVRLVSLGLHGNELPIGEPCVIPWEAQLPRLREFGLEFDERAESGA